MNNLFDMVGECRHLSDNELIYNITNSERTVSQFNEFLNHNENFSVETLFQDLTPGRKKVAFAAVELYKRMQERKADKQVIKSSMDVYNIMRPLIGELEIEEFWLIVMNQSAKVVKKIRLSSGGIDGTYVDVRILLKQAIINNATQIVVAHNHPSGSNRPSREDNNLTEKIRKSAELMGIRLADHLIICSDKYYSYMDEGNF